MQRLFSVALAFLLVIGALCPGHAEAESATVYFDANCPEEILIESLTVKQGTAMTVAQAPVPERAGYRFAGWFTVPDPEVVDGVVQNEWIFGNKYLYGSGQAGEVTSMPVTADMTLYARWTAPAEIKTTDDLFSIRNDLTGWYVLTDDIDLTGITDWTPIGSYLGEYEMANPEWWQAAFRGHFDGNGHIIKGLAVSNRQGFGAALFQAAANAVIENVTVSDYQIEIREADSLYTAPLVGFAQGEKLLLKNCHTDGIIRADMVNLDTEMAYVAVTGLVAAAWGGRIEDCSAAGDMEVTAHVKNGAEVNIGGINGEGYAAAAGCRVNMDITARVISDAGGEKDEHTELYVGGIQGAATTVNSCISEGSITASMQKKTGNCAIAVGGIVGEERYGSVDHNRSGMQIIVEEGRMIYAGGLAGRYNTGTYGMIGFFFGIKENRIEKCLSLSTITLAEGFEREEAVIGPAISSMPTGSMAAYVLENNAALDTGFENAVQEPSVTLYASEEAMYGEVLRDILGDGWVFADGSLPVPY